MTGLPGDSLPNESPVAQTTFRIAEKQYQLHREEIGKLRKGRRMRAGYQVRRTDLSELIDVDDSRFWGAAVQPVSLAGVPTALPPCAAAFSVPAHPGLLLVRYAISAAQQRQLVVEALTVLSEPPSHTNHIRQLGPLSGLWAAAQAGLRLERKASAAATASNADITSTEPGSPNSQQERSSSSSGGPGEWVQHGSGPTAQALLRKLRWATLGPPFDWTRRVYLREAQHRALPAHLQKLAGCLASLAGHLTDSSHAQPDQPQQGSFDAALINFYYEGDTLGGHKDDAEQDLSHPIVAVSLGCPAVLLMGSHTRDIKPTALLLRSGDALVLSGPARSCYHGVPRVFTDAPLPDALECKGEDDPFQPFAQHMRGCRINVSIRATT